LSSQTGGVVPGVGSTPSKKIIRYAFKPITAFGTESLPA
jgi:hypothetical protein